ncbi:alkaline phosphatase D family protein [Sandaracinus amylolyticus]|uniref:alkaline phosphatase D family protein n=1 Tax=Sandaracinus amylolyticus TaxID=927083 RepID=UPI001F47B6EC|nr:alkaline phosphatase D family protein [Sandaracinus amylolyticus]UJR80139.1 Alkaline phosphatase [Sandaracinus amylolyticus]
MRRRATLRTLGLATLAARTLGVAPMLGGCGDDEAPPRATITLGPWPVMPTARSIAIWCEAGVAPDDVEIVGVGTAPFVMIGEGLFLARVEGLMPDTEHRFVVRADVTHEGTFRTMPERDGLVRLAIGADIHPQSAPYVAFDRIRALSPHLYLGLGDQIYADIDPTGPALPTRESYEELYRRTWDDDALRACWANVPTLLVWDDHETWNDFDNTLDDERADVARDAYERMQRSRSPSDDAWTILEAGPASLFVLDTRSFRSPNVALDGPRKTMLGDAQLAALIAWLETSDAPLRVIASPTPLHRYADTGLDAWAHGFTFERDVILRAIEANDPSTVLIVSGDQHWPAVVELPLPGGGTVLELQCTPTAAFFRAAPIAETLGPDVLFVGRDQRGFGWLEIDGATSPPTISFAWIDELGTERFALVRP